MARGAGLHYAVGVAREIAGVIAADSATLTDALIPPGQGLNCSGFETIFVGVEITAGTNPTATIEPLFRDGEAADGSRWHRRLFGAPPGVTLAALAAETTGALTSNGPMVELRVMGCPLVFLRITAVANATSTSNIRILVAPGKPLPRNLR